MLEINRDNGLVMLDSVVASNKEFRDVTKLPDGDKQLTVVWYLCDHSSKFVKAAIDEKEALPEIVKIIGLPKDYKINQTVRDAILFYNEHCDGIAGKTIKTIERGLRNTNQSVDLITTIITMKVKELQKSLDDSDVDAIKNINDNITGILSSQQSLVKLAQDIPGIIDKLIENKNKLKVELTNSKKALGGRRVTTSMQMSQ